ncbi:MAG TPA: OmpA family protein [Bdellovibrionales bacterium]|nr:OmpA family protein [Bdellovibrionales bacterium]
MKRSLAFALLASALAAPASANVVGNGLQNFNTITDGLDFVTIHSSETLKPGLLNLGVFFNEAVNSLPYLESGSQGRTTFNDTLLGLDLNFGLGLTDNWSVGVSAPFILSQTVGSDSVTHGEFRKTGNTEIRLNTKYRLTGDERGGFALIGSVNFDRTTNNPYMGLGAGPVYNLEAAWDTTIKKWAVGVNAGYRKTQPGAPVPGAFFEPVGDQYIGGIAASYHLPSVDTKLIFEIFGSLPAERKASNPDRNASSLELIGGVKHDLTDRLALHGGAGTELTHGVSSPDWRAYTGLNYTFGPLFGARDEAFREKGSPDRILTHAVLFDFDSDQMIGDYAQTLGAIARHLRKRSFKKVIVIGYTDSIGTDSYNESLSLRRATAIRKYLIEAEGFEPERIGVEGLGEAEPIGDNGNFQGRRENRRVEFEIVRGG